SDGGGARHRPAARPGNRAGRDLGADDVRARPPDRGIPAPRRMGRARTGVPARVRSDAGAGRVVAATAHALARAVPAPPNGRLTRLDALTRLVREMKAEIHPEY